MIGPVDFKLPHYRPLTFPLHPFAWASTLLVPFKIRLSFRGGYMAIVGKAEVAEKVKQIVSEQLGVEESEVTPSAAFTDDLGADSLDQVELVMALEEAFSMEISDEEAEKIRTVQDAINYVEKHSKV